MRKVPSYGMTAILKIFLVLEKKNEILLLV